MRMLAIWQGDAVPERDELTRRCGYAFTGHKDPREVERIGRRYGNCFAVGLHPAHRTQRLKRDGQSKLLSQESADEPPTADFAAVLQASQCDQQFPPSR